MTSLNFRGAFLGAILLALCGCSKPADSNNSTASSGAGNGTPSVPAPVPKVQWDDAMKAKVAAASKKAVDYFLGMFNNPDVKKGGWGPKTQCTIGYNALVLGGLLRAYEPQKPALTPAIKDTIDWLLSAGIQDPDGAFVSKPRGDAVYETAVAVRALVAAHALDAEYCKATWGEKFSQAVMRGRDYLLITQIDETPEPGAAGDVAVNGADDEKFGKCFGGWPYGRAMRPGKAPANMSTSNLAAEALFEAEAVTGDTDGRGKKAREKLLNFLRSNHNLHEFDGKPYNNKEIDPLEGDGTKVMPGNDGGAMYSPGVSKAGYAEGQGGMKIAKSYGSMTYALLRMYHMAGLTKNDPRVVKAFEWLTRAENFTFASNAGMPADQQFQGLYYFLYTAAYTLKWRNESVIADSNKEAHDWRADLAAVLLKQQKDTGEWVNPSADRWDEAMPQVATGWALAALGYLK